MEGYADTRNLPDRDGTSMLSPWLHFGELSLRQMGVRVARLRFGVVLDLQGGALSQMLPLFRLGLGGRLGSGWQWMSWIAIDDAVGAMLHALRDEHCVGPINGVAPEPVTNAEFAAVLWRTLRRPAMLPAPAWGLRLAVRRDGGRRVAREPAGWADGAARHGICFSARGRSITEALATASAGRDVRSGR